MKTKIFFASAGLIILFVSGGYAQIGQIKGAKFTKRTEIRKFDFLNAKYETCEGSTVKMRNGHFAPRERAGAYFEMDVAVSYGDLTGDGVEEAIVVTECSGAVQNLDEGKIYTVKNHRLVKLAELEVGTKNGGSIYSGKIKNGKIVVVRGPSPNLCTNIEGAAEEIAVFRLRGGKLQKVGKSICKMIE